MTGLIELKLLELNQLFNSMDPSPFHDRDLDRDAEEFIVSWAQEHPREHDLRLLIHLARPPAGELADLESVKDSIRHYFDYRAGLLWREFRLLMREGRASLLIGLGFIAVCQMAAQTLLQGSQGWQAIAREGLTVLCWVALWKPIDLYLYRWWPRLRRRRLFQRLAVMDIEIRVSAAQDGNAVIGTGRG